MKEKNFRLVGALGICLGFLVLVGTTARPALAAVNLHSAMRLPGESARQAYDRYRQRLGMHFDQQLGGDTPTGMARPVNQLDLKLIPRWNPNANPAEAFSKVRDSRFLADPSHSGFMRRSSWLYPDDGCFARAALMGQNLEKWGFVRPAKAFIFGNLTVATPNSPSGSVSWWYHVVPIVMVGDTPVIFDPAINPKGLTPLKDWILTMTDNPAKVTMAICNPKSYSPSSPCMDMAHSSEEQAVSDQNGYLNYEWARLVQMKRNPEKELGEFPPWFQSYPSYPSFQPGWRGAR